MSQEIFITYSLIKSLYEEGRDYLDVFVPFLLTAFPNDKRECEKDFLSKEIKGLFNLEIPEYTLNAIVTRATRKAYVMSKEKRCILTDKGLEYKNEMLTKQDEERRKVNSLIEDITSFINSKYSINYDNEKVSSILFSFLEKYRANLITFFFNPKIICEDKWRTEFTKDDFYLSQYLRLVERSKPNEFNNIKNILYGTLISSVASQENISEVNKKFAKIKIFLDTNFMFSILDLHYPYICNPAKELFILLKHSGFQLKVFDFTVAEMIRVLKGYAKEGYKYFPNIKVDTIYSSLKSKGWTREDCIRFISKIEQPVDNLGIKIEYTGIDLNNWEIPDNAAYRNIANYKPDQPLLGQKHDICAIEKIKEIRKRPQREIESCVAIFLTSDLKLTKFAFLELGHRDYFSVSEVVTDRFLTTLLWLKNPKTVGNLPVNILLSIYSELLIDRRIWDRFYENLVKLKEEGKISEEDISTLIYYHQIEEDLALISDPDKVTSKFVLEKIERSKINIDEDLKRKIAEEKRKIEEKYTEEMAKRHKQFLDRIENIKSNLRHTAEKRAKRFANLVWSVPIILFVTGIILIKYDYVIATIIALLSFLIAIFGIKIDLFKLKSKIYIWKSNKIYKKQLKELLIEEDKI